MVSLINRLGIAKSKAPSLGLICTRKVPQLSTTTAAPYTTDDGPRILKAPDLTSMKRGTGGRSSFNGMVVSIFGSTGFLGKYVANHFGKIGSQMILCYRGDYYPAMMLKPAGDLGQVLFHFYELNDEETIRQAVKYSNVVVNLVGRSWETRNFTFNQVHVDGARRIARVCREMGVERLIHLSAMNASPDPTPVVYKEGSNFLRSKYWGEQAVLEEFPNATIIRPSEMYGQMDHFIYYYAHHLRHRSHAIPLWDKGEKTAKAPVYGGDIAQAIVNAAKDPETAGKIYQGIGPRRYKLSDIVDWMHQRWRKDEDWGYKRLEMRHDYLFFLRVWLNHQITFSHYMGDLHKERIEREHVSDVIDYDMPTLADLGVKQTFMEDQMPHDMFLYTAQLCYTPEAGEFPIPPDPKPLGPRDEL